MKIYCFLIVLIKSLVKIYNIEIDIIWLDIDINENLYFYTYSTVYPVDEFVCKNELVIIHKSVIKFGIYTNSLSYYEIDRLIT